MVCPIRRDLRNWTGVTTKTQGVSSRAWEFHRLNKASATRHLGLEHRFIPTDLLAATPQSSGVLGLNASFIRSSRRSLALTFRAIRSSSSRFADSR